VLADAEHAVREGLRCLLEREKDFEVVAEVADGLKAIAVVGRLRPSVLLLEVALPGLNGLDVIQRIHETSPGTAILVVSRYADAPRVATALRHGAVGFVVKHATGTELRAAIRSASAGKRYLSRPIVGVGPENRRTVATDPYQTLTAREREMLQLAAEGYSRVDMARRLGISSRTAETHRANALNKLGLRNRVEMIRYALGRGILVPLGGSTA
jgi:DNA-binding NarL/FixJ family response regulator